MSDFSESQNCLVSTQGPIFTHTKKSCKGGQIPKGIFIFFPYSHRLLSQMEGLMGSCHFNCLVECWHALEISFPLRPLFTSSSLPTLESGIDNCEGLSFFPPLCLIRDSCLLLKLHLFIFGLFSPAY